MYKQELPSSRQQTQRWYISEDSAGFHWWPLPIAIFAISSVIYAGAFSYDQGWLDEFTGNLTRIQFHDPDVLQGGCMAINHKMTWREMNNKARKCSRGQYYDALHNDCFACAAPVPQDRIFGLTWDVQANCYDMMTFPDFRYTTHIYWYGATLDSTSGAVVLPERPDNHTAISRCMVETRMRCIKQIGVIGGPKSEFAGALKSDANIETFVSSAVKLVTKYRLDGLHIADVGGNDNSNNGDWKTNYGPTVVKYLGALRKALNDLQSPNTPPYTLSWEELSSAFDTSTNSTSYKGCKQTSDSSGTYRCFNSDIVSSVDWINFQTFGRNPSVSLQSLLNSKAWMSSVPSTKFVFSTCSVPGANMCRGSANGKDELVIVAKAGSDFYKGVSLDSGTDDIQTNKGSSISAMGPLGAYGVLMPQRHMGTEGMAEDDLAVEHVFGNFHDYYTFNPEAERIRFLSPSLRSSLSRAFHEQNRVYYMDIGCNEGKLTKAVHEALKNPQALPVITTDTTFSVDNICLLNEKLQKHHQNPEYVTIEDGGTGHRKHFVIHVFIANVFFGTGDGVSKKVAKAKAAGQALERLNAIEAAELPTSIETCAAPNDAEAKVEVPMNLYTIGIDVDPVLIDRAQRLVKNDKTLHFEVGDVMLGGQLDSICKNHLENTESFDLISCFSITMWIHLNHGDAGLLAFLNLVASKTKHLLIEPQPWKCYKTAIRRLERLNHKIPASFRQIQIKQNVVQVIETHLNDLFPHKMSLGKTNWSRLVLLYSKEPLQSPQDAK